MIKNRQELFCRVCSLNNGSLREGKNGLLLYCFTCSEDRYFYHDSYFKKRTKVYNKTKNWLR